MSRQHHIRTVLDCYPRIYFACHTRHVRDEPTGTVLSRHQASILSHLDDADATSLSDLAAHMGVTPSTMSLSVKRLERQGYITRTRSRVDRRVTELRLSEAGVRVRDTQSVLDADRVAGMLDHLDPADRDAALHGLQLLAEAAGAFMRSAASARFAG